MQLKLKNIAPWVISIVVLCTLAIAYVNKGINSVEASSAHKNHSTPHLAPVPPQNDGATPIQANRLIPGVLSGSPANIVYAPRDVVDMTRLVLETSNKVLTNADKYAEHTHKMIELSTQVIVVFFVVLGAIGALVGIHRVEHVDHKIDAFEKDGKLLIQKHDDELKKLMSDHDRKLEGLSKQAKQQSEALVELLNGRHCIDQGMQLLEAGETNAGHLSNKWFQRGADRLEQVLDRYPDMASVNLVRGLMDIGVARKRLGQYDKALDAVERAVKIAQTDFVSAVGSLSFNAGCYCALTGQPDKAIEYLKRAIDASPDLKVKLDDADLNSLVGNLDFNKLRA
jgi:tetratricopeptide (TPR) repeat protein